MLETDRFTNGDIRLLLHPFLIHEAAKNEAVFALRALDLDRVK
jgi:hypothetical protein